MLAFDACPKDKQRYSASSRDVRELGLLVNRTPAAVSRSFANIWAAMTDGREGLANYAELCGDVVREYLNDTSRLRRDATRLRGRYIHDSLHPRLEIHSDSVPPLLDADLRAMGFEAVRETRVPRQLFVLYRRQSAIVEGAVLVLFGSLAAPIAERFVRWIEGKIQRDRDSPGVEVIRNQAWTDLLDGKKFELQERIILHYLPSVRVQALSSKTREGLASFLAPILGVSPTPSVSLKRLPTPSASRRKEMERRLGIRLSRLSPRALSELDSLLRVADTRGFRKAVKQLDQTRLEEFEPRGEV